MSESSVEKRPRVSENGRGEPHHLHPGDEDLILRNGMRIRLIPPSGEARRSGPSGEEQLTFLRGSLVNLLDAVAGSSLPHETLESLLVEITDTVTQRQPRGGALTQANADFLLASGALTENELAALESRVNAGELAQTQLETRLGALTRTETAEQVGVRLGISASRVRHRQSDHHLYAFRAGKSRHYPLWQFVGTSDRVVPRLAAVLPAMPAGWQPASVEGFMVTPQEGLSADDRDWMSPVEWLASGGEPAAVVAILERIARS